MKRICIALLLCIVICGPAAFAQTAVGIKLGSSLSTLTSGSSATPASGGYSYILGPDAAVFVNIPVTGGFSLQPQLQYAAQGGMKNGLQPVYVRQLGLVGYNEDYAYINLDHKLKTNYLFLPVLGKLSFDLSDVLTIYADGGPYAGLLLSAKTTENSNGIIYADQRQQTILTKAGALDGTYNVKDNMQPLVFGLEGDVGIQLNLDSYSIFFEGGGNYGFSNIYKNMPYTHRISAYTAHIGICKYF